MVLATTENTQMKMQKYQHIFTIQAITDIAHLPFPLGIETMKWESKITCENLNVIVYFLAVQSFGGFSRLE